MEPHLHESEARADLLRRRAGRMLGVMGIVCALLSVLAVLSATGLGLAEGTVGVLLGVAGYMLGSRFFGNAAVISCLAALFVVMVLGQNLL